MHRSAFVFAGIAFAIFPVFTGAPLHLAAQQELGRPPHQPSAAPRQQQPVLIKMDPNPYEAVPDWSLPYMRASEGYAWGSVPGIFFESDDRIFVASRGEIKLPTPVPPAFKGFFGTLRSALNAPENEVRNCLRVVDSSGKTTELWSQWDKLFEGTNGPHKIRISPYDPQHRVWVVGETKNVVYVFFNDGKAVVAHARRRGRRGR